MLLGAVAASGVLPISEDTFRAAIAAEGKAVDANLRGFEAGRAQRGSAPLQQRPAHVQSQSGGSLPPWLPAGSDRLSALAPEVRAGIARLTDYQDAAYAQRIWRASTASSAGLGPMAASSASSLATSRCA